MDQAEVHFRMKGNLSASIPSLDQLQTDIAALLGAPRWRVLPIAVDNATAAVAILELPGEAPDPLPGPGSDSHYQLLLNLIFDEYKNLDYLDPTFPPHYEFHRFSEATSGCYTALCTCCPDVAALE